MNDLLNLNTSCIFVIGVCASGLIIIYVISKRIDIRKKRELKTTRQVRQNKEQDETIIMN